MDARFKWMLIEVLPGTVTIRRGEDGRFDHRAVASASAIVGTRGGRRQVIETHEHEFFNDGSGADCISRIVRLSLVNAREAAESFIEAANAALEDAQSSHADQPVDKSTSDPDRYADLKKGLEHALTTGEFAAQAWQV